MGATVVDLTEYRKRKQRMLTRLRTEAPPQTLVDSVLGPDTDDWDEYDLAVAVDELNRHGITHVKSTELALELVRIVPGATLFGETRGGHWVRLEGR